jgi:hypothetical protein
MARVFQLLEEILPRTCGEHCRPEAREQMQWMPPMKTDPHRSIGVFLVCPLSVSIRSHLWRTILLRRSGVKSGLWISNFGFDSAFELRTFRDNASPILPKPPILAPSVLFCSVLFNAPLARAPAHQRDEDHAREQR